MRFLPKSFYFFFNRIARYAQSKEIRNLSSKKSQITCKAIFRNCLMKDTLQKQYVLFVTNKYGRNGKQCLAEGTYDEVLNVIIERENLDEYTRDIDGKFCKKYYNDEVQGKGLWLSSLRYGDMEYDNRQGKIYTIEEKGGAE